MNIPRAEDRRGAGRTVPPVGSATGSAERIEVGLNAVIVAVTDEQPRVLVVRPTSSDATAADADLLPSGSLDAAADRTLDLALRRWVREQTGIDLGYIEQLYTFGDRDRDREGGRRLLSIAYLALSREQSVRGSGAPAWHAWYDYLPWEDWRSGQPKAIPERIAPELERWGAEAEDPGTRAQRKARSEVAFGLGTMPWDPNRVLDRYELLYEAGVIAESATGNPPESYLGRPMALDHRRIVAAALERLRGKLDLPPGRLRIVTGDVHTAVVCSDSLKRSQASVSTSRIFAASSSRHSWWSGPVSWSPRPVDDPRSSSVSS